MADPMAAMIAQLKNIQVKTGKTIAEMHAAVAASGAAKHSDKRSWLMARFKLGHGDANTLVHLMDKPIPDLAAGAVAAAAMVSPVQEADALDAIYAGTKAGLRPLHEAVMTAVRGFGSFEVAPKKAYVSLRRKKQFAMVGPATKDSVEIGLNAKNLPVHARLRWTAC